MLTTDQINELHRLYWSERWPIRKIERHLRMNWRTIKKYLDAPAQAGLDPKSETKSGSSPKSVISLLRGEAGEHSSGRWRR